MTILVFYFSGVRNGVLEMFKISNYHLYCQTKYEKLQIFNKLLQNRTSDSLLNHLSRNLILRRYCANVAKKNYKNVPNGLIYSDEKKVIYCEVPKAACTNWKRVFHAFENKTRRPMDIKDREAVHRLKYHRVNNLPKRQRTAKMNHYLTFLFVRHPYERLISTYRNKFQDPYDPYYQRTVGSVILRMFNHNMTEAQYIEGKGVSFKQFISYIIKTYDKSGHTSFDIHWQLMVNLCRPCEIKYDFIGKIETLIEDSHHLMHALGVENIEFFPKNATDKYNIKTNTLIKKLFSQFSVETMNKLYKIYQSDFEAFGCNKPL